MDDKKKPLKSVPWSKVKPETHVSGTIILPDVSSPLSQATVTTINSVPGLTEAIPAHVDAYFNWADFNDTTTKRVFIRKRRFSQSICHLVLGGH
jgi:hypothetical protein